MKVVCCKKCGAKYQLDDNDDISAFECTSCTGELELCEGSISNENDNYIPNNSNITYCVDCGLKYALNPSDNILDYECESCGGSLRYVDEEMNEDIDKIVKERENQLTQNRIISNIQNNPNASEDTQTTTKSPINSVKSFSSRFENLFSEKGLHSIANEEQMLVAEESKKEDVVKKTARTKIPNATRRRFEKEFLVPKTNDYNVLKEFLKDEFFKGVSQYYGIDDYDSVPNGSYRSYSSKSLYDKKEKQIAFDNSIKSENESLKSPKNLAIIIGATIFILSIGEILLINSGIGIFALFVGVILICYGLYRKKDEVEVKKRSKIVREHLLTLPEEYYVFYDVKIPGSNKGINHLVIGPSGIYEILSQKYNPKNNAAIEKAPNEEVEKEERIEEIIRPNNMRLFRYTTKQTKFPQDNKIKQESLRLGENLINFLSDNEIRNCFVEPLVGFVNENVVVINMPLTDEDLFIDELLHKIEYGSVKLDSETIDKCAVLLSKYAADCSNES
ncbi:MAG: NERD domain-containing protein [Methanobrevibacter sp.]|uniref:NERD domain-containing protein n=1 Tax=Methanobrevibacter sp. TaxID=66852 RepID=UPI0026DF8219|nr:NERD domain-containing protein [Methanobrevibacter sp.]MDO5848214.1 NERD domain-containing protein [Methanobrevibacter sp.]